MFFYTGQVARTNYSIWFTTEDWITKMDYGTAETDKLRTNVEEQVRRARPTLPLPRVRC